MEKEIEERIKELIKEKNYKRIIKICDKILIKDKDKIAFFYRGLSKYYLEKYEESIKDYDEAIKYNSKYQIAYGNRGLSKYYLGKYKEAIEDFYRAIELNSKDIAAYNNMGLSKLKLGKYKEAIEDFDKAIKLKNNYSIAYNNKGVSEYYLKQYEKAVISYSKAIKYNSKYQIAYSNRGKSRYYLGKYKKAIKDFDKAIELKNKNQEIYIFKSICHLFLKEKNEFIESFREYSKFKNNNNYIYQIIMIAFDEFKSNNISYIEKLINNEYDELWKDDAIFSLLSQKSYFQNATNNIKKILKCIKSILLYQYLLLKSLSFNINDNIEISHYTSLNTLLLLLNDKKEYKNKEKDKNKKEDKENKEDEGKIRIVNISNANDPKEGKILESIFNKNGLDIKISDNEENLITLQTSFSRNKDSLTMFRLYGKNENKEATGVCLVIDKKYFNDKSFSPPIQISSILSDDKKLDNKEEQIDNFKRNLFWILYYTEKENKLIFNPKHSKYKNIIINLNNIEKLKSKYDTKKGKTTLNDKKEIIEYIFSNIYYYTKELDKKIKDKNLKNDIFSNLFENIKYLIKDEAFFEEQELRILITTNYEGREIKIDNYNKRLYINYMKLFDENDNYINEIILGSKVENAESIVEYIKKLLSDKYKKEGIKKKDIKISISKAPLR